MISTILLVFAFVLFVLRAFAVGLPRIDLGWAGLACWVGSLLLSGIGFPHR